MDKIINIKGRAIGKNSPVFIIAELSANHNHDYDIAIKSIKAAKDAGADAVKIQTYTPDTITIDCDNKYFKINQGTIWDGKALYELYEEAYTPWEWQPKLKKFADKIGITLFSSPFDRSAVDFLEKMNVPAYKVASFEITDIPLIKYIASKGKPIILSSGIAKKSEIKDAVKACRDEGNNNIAVLKCTSAYPSPPEELNLRTIPDIEDRFNVIAGLSDHTIGSAAAVASCALGAKIIEKHFILDKKIGGPDASFSMEPKEFKEMVDKVRFTEKALGGPSYELSDKLKKSREFSRSLFVIKDIKKGEKFSPENIRSIRPGFGAPPSMLSDVIGEKAKLDLKRGTPFKKDFL